MKAKSIKGESPEDVRVELVEAMSDGFTPTLAIVFMSVVEEVEKVCNLLDNHHIAIFGATTSGEFTDQGIQDRGIVMLLLDMKPDYFKIAIKNLENLSPLKASEQIGEIGLNTFSDPAFIISGSDLSTPGEELIKGLNNKVGTDVNIIGGVAGEPVFFKGIVFTNKKAYSKGVISLIMNQDKIELNGLAVSGWKPVGTEKTITGSEESWIKTIDNKPALSVLKRFMGEDFFENEKVGSETIVRLNTTFPLQVKRKIGCTVMRPPLLANLEDQSILCGGIVEEGDVFRFSMPPDFEVIDKVIESSIEIKNNKMPHADALLVFSCVGRFASLGPMINSELEGLTKTWDKPMAGFFCLGEFGKAEGGDKADFHGTTCSWVAIKER